LHILKRYDENSESKAASSKRQSIHRGPLTRFCDFAARKGGLLWVAVDYAVTIAILLTVVYHVLYQGSVLYAEPGESSTLFYGKTSSSALPPENSNRAERVGVHSTGGGIGDGQDVKGSSVMEMRSDNLSIKQISTPKIEFGTIIY
jgi:hypothetical protein